MLTAGKAISGSRAYRHVYSPPMVNKSVQQQIDINGSGGTVTLDLHGLTVVDLVIDGTGRAAYTLDIRDSDGNWTTGVGPTYDKDTYYDDTVNTGAAAIRVRCTSGTGGSADTATVTLIAGGTR